MSRADKMQSFSDRHRLQSDDRLVRETRVYIYIYMQSWIIWSKTFIATQSFMLLAKQSSGNCQK